MPSSNYGINGNPGTVAKIYAANIKDDGSKYHFFQIKNIGSKEPGFDFPPGRGLSMTLLCSTYLWSVGVMEYWKNKTQLRSSVTLIRGHWDSLMHRVHER